MGLLLVGGRLYGFQVCASWSYHLPWLCRYRRCSCQFPLLHNPNNVGRDHSAWGRCYSTQEMTAYDSRVHQCWYQRRILQRWPKIDVLDRHCRTGIVMMGMDNGKSWYGQWQSWHHGVLHEIDKVDTEMQFMNWLQLQAILRWEWLWQSSSYEIELGQSHWILTSIRIQSLLHTRCLYVVACYSYATPRAFGHESMRCQITYILSHFPFQQVATKTGTKPKETKRELQDKLKFARAFWLRACETRSPGPSLSQVLCNFPLAEFLLFLMYF